jgi:hypothetical protein
MPIFTKWLLVLTLYITVLPRILRVSSAKNCFNEAIRVAGNLKAYGGEIFFVPEEDLDEAESMVV